MIKDKVSMKYVYVIGVRAYRGQRERRGHRETREERERERGHRGVCSTHVYTRLLRDYSDVLSSGLDAGVRLV